MSLSDNNNNPSIDILFLTTHVHVGGQGLNLTSADKVIFVENDWNPMKDLQVRTPPFPSPFILFIKFSPNLSNGCV